MITTHHSPYDKAEAFAGAQRFYGWGKAYEAGEQWAVTHMQEVRRCFGVEARVPPSALAKSVVYGIAAWLDYAEAHRERYESAIGEDYVLGPEWEAWGKALRGLLNGETGLLDCGTLDSLILDNLKRAGFDEE